MTALVKLQSHGITEDRILYINNILENNGYNINIKSHSWLDHYRSSKYAAPNFISFEGQKT
jgi:hypothetical protein